MATDDAHRVVGFAELETYPHVPRHRHAADLQLLAVRESARHHGVGRRLLDDVLELALEAVERLDDRLRGVEARERLVAPARMHDAQVVALEGVVVVDAFHQVTGALLQIGQACARRLALSARLGVRLTALLVDLAPTLELLLELDPAQPQLGELRVEPLLRLATALEVGIQLGCAGSTSDRTLGDLAMPPHQAQRVDQLTVIGDNGGTAGQAASDSRVSGMRLIAAAPAGWMNRVSSGVRARNICASSSENMVFKMVISMPDSVAGNPTEYLSRRSWRSR